ncbi:hypothetical protein B7463_g5171, partial [Scytalidium lignicola]
MSSLIRVTMCKIPNKDDRKKLIALYEVLKATQSKDGKPYILSMQAGEAEEDPRSDGYNFVSKTEFKSKEDMDYYDTGCEAHQTLKAGAKSAGITIQGLLTVYYYPAIVHSV